MSLVGMAMGAGRGRGSIPRPPTPAPVPAPATGMVFIPARAPARDPFPTGASLSFTLKQKYLLQKFVTSTMPLQIHETLW